MENPEFERPSSAEFPAVKALLVRCGLPTDDLQPAHLEHFVVCRISGKLVGAVGLEVRGDLGLLRSLAVATEHRGRRLADGLCRRIMKEALRHGIRRLYLLTTTAEALFARLDFARVGRDTVPAVIRATAEYRSLCPNTATVMTTDLKER